MRKWSSYPNRRIRGRLPRFATCEGGMAAVEFAFIGPILSILLLGIADFGWLALQRSDMHSAVRSGAQYVMAGGQDEAEALEIVRASWTQAPAEASLEFAQFCRCGEQEHACSAPCPDASAPEAYTRLVISAPLEGVFRSDYSIYTETIRIR